MSKTFYQQPSDYLSCVPEFWRRLPQIQAIAGACCQELDRRLERAGRIIDNRFPSTVNEEGAARWEQLLGLTTPRDGTLQGRRDQIRACLMSKPPINLRALEVIIEAYMGVQVQMEVENYLLSITYRGEIRQKDLAPLMETLYRLIPAKLLVQIAYAYLIWDELDQQNLTWDQLDAKGLSVEELEMGTWVTEQKTTS